MYFTKRIGKRGSEGNGRKSLTKNQILNFNRPVMKKLLILIFSLILFSAASHSQDYRNAVGIRLGLSNGISLKHFFSTNKAVEGILTVRWGGYNLTGLVEKHRSIFDTDGLYLFYGAGLHMGSFSNSWFNDTNNHTVIGLDGIIGFEYVFRDLPLNVSLDYKPAFNLFGNTGFWGDEVALTGRYIF
jgi:opacity protein-like surface antigen